MRKRTFISVVISFLTILFVSSTTVSAQIEVPARDQQMVEFAKRFDSAEALYNHLKDEADGGQPLVWDNLPDWSGVYTRGAGGIRFDPVSGDDGPTTATLTSEYQEKYDQKLERISQNLEFDPLTAVAGQPLDP